MTVAAVVLAATAESALADAGGVARVRRIADAAWSGGALPVIVVAPDRDGAVAAALAGAEATLVAPVDPEAGPVGQIAHGIDAAYAAVHGTSAALIWPVRLCWAGPETVTSLVEAHGLDPARLLRPGFGAEAGWPALLPVAALDAFRSQAAGLAPAELLDGLVAAGGTPGATLDLGDPGTVIDGSTPREDLPPYEGPAGPLADHAHEWGEALAGVAAESGRDRATESAREAEPAG